MEVFSAIEKLLPEHIETLYRRHEILRAIHALQPVGRRVLSMKINVTERVLRKDVEMLRDEGLIIITSTGMTITDAGSTVLLSFERIIKEQSGMIGLENTLKDKLNVNEVVIVEGNCDENGEVKAKLGQAAANVLMRSLKNDNLIATTGGTTLGSVARMVKPDPKHRKMVFVPARGGLGERVEFEANTICAQMANRTSSPYYLLHVPEEVSPATYEVLVKEKHVKEVLAYIRQSTIVIHGIGDAQKMAKRRRASKETLEKLQGGHAVGEAFGYYFDENGNVVHQINSIGIQLSDLKKDKKIITVAGGSSKVAAIQAYIKMGYSDVLITDEGAAKQLINLNKQKI
jgi:central glycolytic genes regulator